MNTSRRPDTFCACARTRRGLFLSAHHVVLLGEASQLQVPGRNTLFLLAYKSSSLHCASVCEVRLYLALL
jgi:hypothetical protein